MKVLIIGGNKFFGRHLAQNLIRDRYEVTLLNRGQIDDGFGNKIHRLKVDRQLEDSLRAAVKGKKWDLIFDQVCYTASEAKIACNVFDGKTSRYIVTSSESIYENGTDQVEDLFDPKTYQFDKEASPIENYQEAKRQVESVFSKSSFAEVVIVRPSLVVGLDDYTGRLKWHLDRIRKGLPIYFPNLDIKSDFIRSDQAGLALKMIGSSRYVGAINLTCPGSVSLRNLLVSCENATGEKAILAKKEEEGNHSPYGGLATKTMNTNLLSSLGVELESSELWLENLIVEIAGKNLR